LSPTANIADAPALRRDLKRAGRRRRWLAMGLVAPLFLFLLVTFALPILDMLRRSVTDNELSSAIPAFASAVRKWDRISEPPEALYAALGRDLKAADAAHSLAVPARRLNYAIPNGRSLVMNTGRALRSLDAEPPSWRGSLIGIDAAWGERRTWIALAQAAGPLTDFYLLAAVDLERDPANRIVEKPEGQRLYRQVLARTFGISLTVTLLCLLLGFPVAYLIASLPERTGNLLMVLVLLPFWTSLLVRSAAWIVLLQDRGLINQFLQASGLTEDPVRLIYNRTGVIIAMTHVLLPFMIMPLIATMNAIPPAYMRAAISLGAHPAIAFIRVYLPQTLPGLTAGALLVFIMALGYYITPSLVGGADDQMLSYFIAFFTNSSANWGLAAALSVLLLGATLILYAVYAHLAGMGQIKLG
jgi:putative spermidine/putrescine transport system permease protein